MVSEGLSRPSTKSKYLPSEDGLGRVSETIHINIVNILNCLGSFQDHPHQPKKYFDLVDGLGRPSEDIQMSGA